jgi:ArsR family transcriptional regulator, arsenate/arsenite/antimonite-responsive transcriptional repressor
MVVGLVDTTVFLGEVEAPTTATHSQGTPVAYCVPLGAPAMSDVEAAATAALFKALGHPHRVRIVNLLATSPGPVCVCELIDPLRLSQPTISHHLKQLVTAGLLTRVQRGRSASYSLDRQAMARLTAVTELASGSR